MFMAIINLSYMNVKEDYGNTKRAFMLSDYLKTNYRRIVDKFNVRRNRILDIQDVLRSDHIATEDCLDFKTWRKELKAKGYTDIEIETLFTRYDYDCNGTLNEIEKLRLIRDIARAKSHIGNEFREIQTTKKLSNNKKDAFE
jgi:hypothetical protein